MYYRNPLAHNCVDKLAVRDYVKDKGLESILTTIYGVYLRGEDIDFDRLPSKFVLKTNDGSGGNNIVLCDDKTELDREVTVKMLNSWLNFKNINPGREWAYSGIKESLIMAEEFLEAPDDDGSGLMDYKFFCFNGEPCLIQVDGYRYSGHKRNFYDLNWNPVDLQHTYPNFDHPVTRPQNLDRMIEIAKKLSEDFPHVRVDLYNLQGRIYFGEITFYPGSGYEIFNPQDFDLKLGRKFDLSSFYPAQN